MLLPQTPSSLASPAKPVDATCPLSGFDADAVEWSIPPALLELRGKYRGGGKGGTAINVTRIWATIVSVATLLRFDESWLVSGDGEADETIVDRAMGWLEIQVFKFPELDERLANLLGEANALVAESWELAHDIAIKTAREEQMKLQELHRVSQMTRAAGHMATMSLVKHETMACFTVRA